MFLILCVFSSLFAWESDYAKALEASQKDEKPLLLFFTGSDWSGLAMKMKKEVLDEPSFQEKIGDSFHCVQIDFPVHTTLPSQRQQENETLKNRFKVDEYPLLLLLDGEEREISRVGYLPESGEQLAYELLHIVSQDGELRKGLKNLPLEDENSLLHLYNLAQSLGSSQAEERILAQLRARALASEDYQLHFTLALLDFQNLASTVHDPREVIKPLEAYLDRFGDKDEENVWRIEMMIAQFYLDADEWGKALKHAQTAYETAPGKVRGEIENSLHYIREQIR